MKQELLLKQDELVRTHELGEFKKEYTMRFDRRQFVKYGTISIVILIAVTISFIIASALFGFSSSILIVIVITVIVSLLLAYALIAVWFSYYRDLHIYLYDGGLVYHFPYVDRVVRWEQIKKVSINSRGGYIRVYVKDKPSLGFPEIEDLGPTIIKNVKYATRHSGKHFGS